MIQKMLEFLQKVSDYIFTLWKTGEGEELNNNIHSYREGMRALVDWVQFTIPLHITEQQEAQLKLDKPDEEDQKKGLQIVYDLLQIPESEFVDMDFSRNSYKKHKSCGSISILYDGTYKMGTHVIITGQGCREYEQMILLLQQQVPENSVSLNVWRDLFMKVLSLDGHFTRIDGAIDDFSIGNHKVHFDIEDLSKRIDKGLCSSTFDDVYEQNKRKIATGLREGMTLYFGSPKSDIRIVFYDKFAERKSKGKALEDGLTAWNRTEVRLKNKHTYEFVFQVVNGHDLGKLVSRIIIQYVKFHEKSKLNELGQTVETLDTNKSRWKLWRNWGKFIGGVEALKLHHIAPDRTIEKSMGWIDDKVKKSLARIFVAEPLHTMDWIMEKIKEGTDKFDSKDENMIKTYWRTKEAYESLFEGTDKEKELPEEWQSIDEIM